MSSKFHKEPFHTIIPAPNVQSQHSDTLHRQPKVSIQIARTCENPIVHCAVPNFIAYNPIRKIP